MPVHLRNPADDDAWFSRPAQSPGLELMLARWVRHSFPKHGHDCFTIGINVAGGGVFDCRRDQRWARPGTLNLIAPEEIHTGRASTATGWTYVDFYVAPGQIDR